MTIFTKQIPLEKTFDSLWKSWKMYTKQGQVQEKNDVLWKNWQAWETFINCQIDIGMGVSIETQIDQDQHYWDKLWDDWFSVDTCCT